jgi:hypothetical protein
MSVRDEPLHTCAPLRPAQFGSIILRVASHTRSASGFAVRQGADDLFEKIIKSVTLRNAKDYQHC